MQRNLETLEPATEPASAVNHHGNAMGFSDALCLFTLAAIWGGSFLFMRVAAPEFGPVPLIAVRVAIASVFLLPLLAASGGLRNLRGQIRPLVIVGIINSGLPFCLLAFATLRLTAGFTSILNATAPFFTAVVAFFWLDHRLSFSRITGLLIGFAGVVVLLWGRASFRSGGGGMAVAAVLGAAISYGFGANYSKVRLHALGPLAVSAGSQAAAALCLLPIAFWKWPATVPSPKSWIMVSALGIFCTGIAYLLYYRLLVRVGAARTVTVTFLVPPFAMLWGGLFLHERATLQMIGGAVVILIGTSLTTELLKFPSRRGARATAC